MPSTVPGSLSIAVDLPSLTVATSTMASGSSAARMEGALRPKVAAAATTMAEVFMRLLSISVQATDLSGSRLPAPAPVITLSMVSPMRNIQGSSTRVNMVLMAMPPTITAARPR